MSIHVSDTIIIEVFFPMTGMAISVTHGAASAPPVLAHAAQRCTGCITRQACNLGSRVNHGGKAVIATALVRVRV